MTRNSLAAQLTATGIHAVGLAVGLVFVFTSSTVTAGRAWLLAAAGVIYFVRFLVTQFVMLERAFPWSEAAAVGPWTAILQVGLLWLGSRCSAPLGWVAYLGVALYVVGSYLNTGSEWQRRVWKRDPANRGHVYTGGLFSRSVHVNYLGDSVLFTGFAMITGSWWAAVFPALMTAMFIGFHIPRQDAHLTEHYGTPFTDYAARTKKFLPWVY